MMCAHTDVGVILILAKAAQAPGAASISKPSAQPRAPARRPEQASKGTEPARQQTPALRVPRLNLAALQKPHNGGEA